MLRAAQDAHAVEPAGATGSRKPGPAPSPSPSAFAPSAILALQRAAGNRAVGQVLARCAGRCTCGGSCRDEETLEAERHRSASPRVRTLARASSEQQFALSREGQVDSTQVFLDGVPQEAEEDVDEFVLWNFLVNSELVRRGHKKGLDVAARRWATELTENPLLRIRVIGYASVTGGVALNEELARRRAESVRDHLVSLGVPEDQILIDSSGSRLPMDEGDSPESLARNRRVEISKFFATTVKPSLSDLGPGIDIRVRELDFTTNASLKLEVDDENATLRLGTQQLKAGGVRVTSSDPAVEVGFVQFVTKDVRLAGYSDADEEGEVVDFGAPPSAFIDYEHCMDAFTPCRDVQFAKFPFSLIDRDSAGPQRVAHPSPAPSDIFFETAPEIVLPQRIVIPGRGRAVLTQVVWKMSFKIILAARLGELLVPGGGQAWDFTVFSSMVAGPAPKSVSPSQTNSIGVDSTPIPDSGPFPDIERAMSMPSCNLRQRMMNKLCKPTITPTQGSLNGEFDEELRRAQEELKKALERLLPVR